jgi:GAF domain-containing protein
MVRDTSSAVLELLAAGAPADRFSFLVEDARRRGAEGAELAGVERAARLGLSITSRWERHRRRETGLAALLEAVRDLAAAHQPADVLLQSVARRARLLLGLDLAYVCYPDEEAAQVRVRAVDGRIARLEAGLTLPLGRSPAGLAMTDPVPLWTADYLTDERVEHSTAVDEVVRAEGLHTMLAVPLNRQTRPFGVLHVAARRVRGFTADEVALMSAYGDLAGTAVERARVLDRAAALRESGDAHARLLRLVLGGAELGELAEETSKLVDGAVRVCGTDGVPLATTGELPETAWEQAETGALEAHGSCRPVPVGPGLWAAPICTGTVGLGTLLVRLNGPLSDDGAQLLGCATQAMAVLLLLHNSRAAIAEGQVRDDLLDDLLAHPDLSAKKVRARARRLGLDLAGPHVVVVARPEEDSTGRASVWAASYAYRRNGLKCLRHGTAVFLLPGSDPGDAARAVSAELGPLLRHPVTVAGAGPVTDPGAVRHGYQEAVRCLEAMIALGAVGRAGSVGELGFLGLLLSDSRDAQGYIGSVLGPLLTYDEQRLSELTPTLEAFFAAGGSPTYAARRLHVHPNTVARRLERIGELLGPDWQQPARALELQLALRLFRVREQLSGEPAGGR